jgi:putative photosynthetic complex assembly protein
MSATTAAPFPRIQLGAVITVLGCVLVGVTVARFTGFATTQAPTPIASLPLHFNDLADGSVAVLNASNGATITVIPARGGGFIRSTMRVLATERAHDNIGPATPFVLAQMPGGTFELTDPATGQMLDLVAFGPTNEGEFAKIFFASGATK